MIPLAAAVTLVPPALAALAALAGVVVGAMLVYLSPRLVAYRLEQSEPPAPLLTLLPLIGPYLAHWRLWRSLALELFTGAVFAGLALQFGESRRLLLGCLYATILIAIAGIDLDHRLVLNRLSYPGTVVGLAGSFFWPHLGIENAVLGAIVGLVIFVVLQVVSRGALGTGDTKLATCIGAMVGLNNILNALFLGVVLGGLAAAFLWFVLKRGRKSFFAYAPYLSAGAIAALFLPTS